MNEIDAAFREKWNKRYSQSNEIGPACWVLQQHQHLLPKNGRSLDLACGLGANAILLAQHGLESHAWDFSTQAIEKLNFFSKQQQLNILTLIRDIESTPPEPDSFDVIVVSQFLYRPIFPAIIKALKPEGLLFYQTFHNKKITSHGPSNKKYLLSPNELLSHLNELKLVFYREDSDIGQLENGLRDCSYFIGQRTTCI